MLLYIQAALILTATTLHVAYLDATQNLQYLLPIHKDLLMSGLFTALLAGFISLTTKGLK
jgi:hypothetical protein